MSMSISSALEDYIEAIYQISKTKSTVRITDIAARLGISKPSVNRAVNALKKYGLVSHEPYGDIVLTEVGRDKAIEVSCQRATIKRFLVEVLELTDADADTEACRIEHCISRSTVAKMEACIK